MDNKNYEKGNIVIQNRNGALEFLENIKFPVYFLDFEAITNSKQWMFDNGLALDQQVSSFSILKIDYEEDDETKLKHFSIVGEREDYPRMAKSLTDFYRDNGTVVVWGQDLEIRSLAKLMREAPESLHKKLSTMLSKILDLQQLFYSNSFVRAGETGKSSLDVVAKEFGVYLQGKLEGGKKAHYLLEAAMEQEMDESQIRNITGRLEDYNNSDVINIKRILIELLRELSYDS